MTCRGADHIEFRMVIMHRSLNVSMSHGIHDGGQIPGTRWSATALEAFNKVRYRSSVIVMTQPYYAATPQSDTGVS